MEILNTTHQIRAGNRLLTITKSDTAVDIRIEKFTREDSFVEIEDELNIPITMETHIKLVNEMSKSC